MNRISIDKLLILIVGVFLLTGLVGCSDVSKGDKKAYKAVMKHLDERYPVSNKELEIVYPKLKDMPPVVEGRSTAGNDIWDIQGVYKFNTQKVEDIEYLEDNGKVHFNAKVELIDGEYVVTGYTESLQIRGDLDD